MKKPVDHRDLAVAGYVAPWSVRPGMAAAVHLSGEGPAVRVRVVSLIEDEAAPGFALDPPLPVLAPATLTIGSWLEATFSAPIAAADPWLAIEFRLEVPPAGRTLIGCPDRVLRFDADGRLALTAEAGERLVAAGAPAVGAWHVAELALGPMFAARLDERPLESVGDASRLPAADPVTAFRIGAPFDPTVTSLDVRIGRVLLRDGTDGPILHAWHPEPVGQPSALADRVGGGPALAVRNAPTFAVPSLRWDGASDAAMAPDQFDAVHLHADDLADAEWPVATTVAVPADAPSGVYAVEIETAAARERIPFFVVPAAPRAPIAILIPTFTYLAYADEALPPEVFPWVADDRGHRFARANGLVSLYDVHSDGSGVSLAGARRPLATLRDDYVYPLCGCGHLLPVDLRLLRFCRAQGIAVDLLTDHDLDEGGTARLAGYRGLVTGSHPEYWTATMLDAVAAFRADGGHLAYLGGNGFYWVTARQGDLIEVRRGDAGIRTWSDRPGESRLALTGEAGGLWRANGRPEHRLLGIGMAAMGFSGAQPYRRLPGSRDGRAAWIFEGVTEEMFGAEGTVLGGAAGYELDRVSAAWGSPTETIVLARADGFDAGYEADPTHRPNPGDDAPVAADMVLVPGADGSFVFSVGSVSWIGALPDPGADNAVGRITANVLRRMAGAA